MRYWSSSLSYFKSQDVLKDNQLANNLRLTASNGNADMLSSPLVSKPPVVIKQPAVPQPLAVPKPHVANESDENTTHMHHRYVICSSYWEQQSNALLNLFSLQRWANSVGLTTVEPFVCQSELKFPPEVLNNNTLINALRLRDIIDLDYWNAQVTNAGVPPLESWENFVLHSAKRIILVILPYSGAGGIYANDEINKHPECQKKISDFYSKHSMIFNLMQIEVVRNVCISFDHYIIPPETFNAGLQIDDYKDDITVWINEWEGVDNGRVSFTGLQLNQFGRILEGEGKYLSMVKPSRRLVTDSRRYVHQVLGVDFYQYDAVVARHKMHGGHGPEWNVHYFNYCASRLEMHTKSSTNKMSLSIDLGKYGDQCNMDRLDYDSQHNYTGHGVDLFKRYLGIVYENKTIDDYENDFVRVSNGITDSGYIGGLQRTIALHAKRVFLVGGHSSYLNIITAHFVRENKRNAVTKICF